MKCRPNIYLLAAGGVFWGVTAAASPGAWRWLLLLLGGLAGGCLIRHHGWLLWLFLLAGFRAGMTSQNTAFLLPGYGTAEIVLTDARLTSVSGLPPPKAISGELVSFRRTGETAAEPCRRKIQLFLPAGVRVPAYGSRLAVTGSLQAPDGNYFLCENGKTQFRESGYRSYLRSRGIAGLFYAERIDRVTPPGTSWRTLLMRGRDKIVGRLLSGIRDPELRITSAAVTFGITGGISGELRRRYLEAGTIHLFSVSGTHVMLLAAMLALLGGGLPFQLRHWLIGIGCFCYAAATGFNIPALRAFLLVAAWCFLRSRLYFVPPLSLLPAAGGALLLINPFLAADAGFQYTFLITGALLLYRERNREQLELEKSVFSWMAAGRVRDDAMRRVRRRRFWGRACGAAGVAFLAALPVTLHLQSEVPPGSLAANLLLVALLPLIFPALLVKFLLGAFPWGVWVWEIPFRLLDALSGMTQEGFGKLAGWAPPGWLMAVYYLAFFLLLSGKIRPFWGRCIVTGAFIGLIVALFAVPHFRSPCILTAHTGHHAPPQCAVWEPETGRSCILLSPGTAAAKALAAELKRRGLSRVETVYTWRRDKGSRKALQSLLAQLPAGRIPLPGGTSETFFSEISCQKDGFSFAYFGKTSTVKHVFSCRRSDSGCLAGEAAGEKTEHFPFTSIPEVRFYEYEK